MMVSKSFDADILLIALFEECRLLTNINSFSHELHRAGIFFI